MVVNKSFPSILLLFSFFCLCADSTPSIESPENSNPDQVIEASTSIDFTTYQNEIIDPVICKYFTENAPHEIQNLIKCLKNRDLFLPFMSNRLLLYGPPGVGKTTLAKIIAQEANMPYFVIDGPVVANEYKNSGAMNLLRTFEPLMKISNQRPFIIIIDEINYLIGSKNNNNNLDSNTAPTLWLLLDECKSHFPNLVIIGTANDISEIPPQLKSRFSGSLIHIPNTESFLFREKIITFYLNQYPHGCSLNNIRSISRKTSGFDPRELESLVNKAFLEALIENNERPFIKKTHLDLILQQMIKDRKILNPPSSLYKELAWKTLKYTGTALGIISTIYLIYATYQKMQFLEKKGRSFDGMIDYLNESIKSLQSTTEQNKQLFEKSFENLQKQGSLFHSQINYINELIEKLTQTT